jgi:hypothetical protein
MVLRITYRKNKDEVKTPGKTQRPKRSKVRDCGDWVLKKKNLLFDPLRSYSQSAEEMEQSVTAISALINKDWKCFTIQFIPAISPRLRISFVCGKQAMLGAWAHVLFCEGVGVIFPHATRLQTN